MGQARQIMDSLTRALEAGDRSAIRDLYAQDAVAETPDAGRLVGPDAIADYLITLSIGFPDLTFELDWKLEAGDTAVDAGWVIGTNTGPLIMPDGELPPTGKAIRARSCDIITVRDGLAVEHRMYYDQLDFMTQVGLIDQQTITLPDADARARSGVGPDG